MPTPKSASSTAVSRFPRELAVPAPGRPNWADPAGLELVYLGWGRRYYGREPLPVTRHTGWVYIVIPSGTPTLELATRRIALRPGHLFVMHPECAAGWSNRPEGVSSVLSWIWTAPPPAEIAPAIADFRLGEANAPTLARLQRLHAECRREVQTADPATPRALTGLRHQLEAEFTRMFSSQRPSAENPFRFGLACRWIHENLNRRRAIALVAEYLDVSSGELHRLFLRHAGQTPAAYLQAERMRRAEQLVQRGESVKSVAYALGYRHANDLSRAYRRHTGRLLTER